MLSGLLFGISLMGMLLNRQNVILLLICIELMLLAVNTNFIAFSHYYQLISGQVFVFFILTVAAAEAAIGLAIVLRLYRQQGSINVNSMAHLKG
jgi:NADH-quinone oxidoreductase subunit K